jgi:hypothetical protein
MSAALFLAFLAGAWAGLAFATWTFEQDPDPEDATR